MITTCEPWYEVHVIFKNEDRCNVICDYEPSLKDGVIRFKFEDDSDLIEYHEYWMDNIHAITVKRVLTDPSL